MPILRDACKRYGATCAVDGLSLVARPGEVLGLLGPNGAGKRTTVALAAGLVPPDSGEVVIDTPGPPTDRRDPGTSRAGDGARRPPAQASGPRATRPRRAADRPRRR